MLDPCVKLELRIIALIRIRPFSDGNPATSLSCPLFHTSFVILAKFLCLQNEDESSKYLTGLLSN
jgi:hypothetical protein